MVFRRIKNAAFPAFIGMAWICVLVIGLPSSAYAREQIRIVGSSTVYPFVTVAAEQFGLSGKFKTPIVESTGTGGGFKLFCSGIGAQYPDMNDASRAILESEIELCGENGIHDIVELIIGYDGIVLAGAKDAAAFRLTKAEIFQGLARELPDKNGKLIPNPYTRWNEINPRLPDQSIEVYGPPPTSGTRDAFVELVMEHACEDFPAFETAHPDKKLRKKMCGMLREDGRYIEAGEDDNLIIQKLSSNHAALGILGYSFFEENQHRVQASTIDGIVPTAAAIERGEYTVSRSLFVYLKGEHIGKTPGMAEFARELTSEAAMGADGYLTLSGLIPLNAELQQQVRETVAGIASSRSQ